MAGVLIANNAWGTLNVAATQYTTELYLTPGQGDRFPNAVTGVSWFYATLVDKEKNIEIVRVTNRSAETLTVERGVDGTQARAFPVESRVEVRPCAAVFMDKVNIQDFNSTVDTLRGEFENADSTLESNINVELDQIKEDYAKLDYVDDKFEDMKTESEENYLTEEDITDKWLPLTGGEVKGNIRLESEASGGLTMVGGNLTLQKGTADSGSLYGGDINAAGGIYGQYLQSTSDIRLKENVEPLETGWGLRSADRLEPVSFNRAESGEPAIGVVAQDVETVIPEAVKKMPNGMLTVNYGMIATLCLAAVKDLKKEIKESKKWQKR